MRVLLAVLLVVGLVGCGSETEPPSPFSESEAKPPTAAVPPTPPKSTQAKVEHVVADTPQPKVDADPVTKPKPKSAPGSEPKADKTAVQSRSSVFGAVGKAMTFSAPNDNGEVKAIGLAGDRATDALLVHLKELPKLQELWLNRAKITDAGLVHLKELINLKILHLRNTPITDAGLVHLKELTKLERLDLRDTQVADAGLVHLKGMTKLQTLFLSGTKITDAGVTDLQKALPNCKITK